MFHQTFESEAVRVRSIMCFSCQEYESIKYRVSSTKLYRKNVQGNVVDNASTIYNYKILYISKLPTRKLHELCKLYVEGLHNNNNYNAWGWCSVYTQT